MALFLSLFETAFFFFFGAWFIALAFRDLTPSRVVRGFAFPLGIGVLSTAWFGWIALWGAAGWGYVFCVLLSFAAMKAALIYLKRQQLRFEIPDVSPIAYPNESVNIYTQILRVWLAVAIGSAVWVTAAHLNQRPDGDWDALAIWNFKARLFYRAGENWRTFYSVMEQTSHPDYPLLVPGAAANWWTMIGSEYAGAPLLISLLFCYSVAMTLYTAVRQAAGLTAALLAVVVLLCTPKFVDQIHAQYADMPLAFFILATAVSFQIFDRWGSRQWLMLAGFCAGLAAWTKNEGIAFFVVALLARGIAGVLYKNPRRTMHELLDFFLGALAPLVVVAYFKTSVAHSNYLAAQSGDTMSRLTDFSRWKLILSSFASKIFTFGDWKISLVALLIVYAFICGVNYPLVKRKSLLTTILIPILMLGAYFCAYLVTPLDLEWQLNTSLSRLLTQIWPATLFAFFVVVRTPQLSLK